MEISLAALRRIIREELQSPVGDAGSPKRIAIFDFDGTLFRSPEKPEWWPFQGFWGRLETLSEPYVPETPGADWYVGDVVSAAAAAASEPQTYSCLLTGRIPKFQSRVKQIVGNVGVQFDDYYFASGNSTLPFKLGIIEKLISQFPSAEIVEMWEDRGEHIGPFQEKIESLGKKAVIHHVADTPHEFLNQPTPG